ncbi:hypothetical protein ACFLZP_03895 [Patescibacteria group bacterium]
MKKKISLTRALVVLFWAARFFLILDSSALAADHGRIIFLHHSTGGNVYRQGNVPSELSALDSSLSITERNYPDVPYAWKNYPYDYWNLWVNGQCNASQAGIHCLRNIAANYDVIIFKHCYPGAQVWPDTGSPDISSETKSLENYKLQYEALGRKFQDFPNKIFIAWTLAPLVQENISQANANRARQFVTWVENDWAPRYPNVYFFDYFSLMVNSNNYLRDDYKVAEGNSHPNARACLVAGPAFARAIVNAIGDFEGGGPPPTSVPPTATATPIPTATATPTPIPTEVPPTAIPTSGGCLPGDANDNKTVTFADGLFLIRRFFQALPACVDQNNDRHINGLDLGVMLKNL